MTRRHDHHLDATPRGAGTLFAAFVLLAGMGCSTPSAAPIVARSHSVTQNHVSVVATAPACRTGTDCVVTFAITAGGDTHVNKEYPHRFRPDAEKAVTWTKPPPAALVDESNATLRAQYKSVAADASLNGELAVSVCNDAECFIEKVRIDWPTPAR